MIRIVMMAIVGIAVATSAAFGADPPDPKANGATEPPPAEEAAAPVPPPQSEDSAPAEPALETPADAWALEDAGADENAPEAPPSEDGAQAPPADGSSGESVWGTASPEGTSSSPAWETMSPYVRDPQISRPSKPGYVTNFFYDSPLREVLTEIGIQAGVTIMADSTVEGLVTANLEDVPVDKALEIVLTVGDYAWRQMDGFILVGSMDPKTPSFSKLSEIKTIRLDHTKAAAALKTLPESLRRYASADDEANAIVLTAPKERLDQIADIIATIDRAPRQLVLEARVVVMESVDILDMGIQWDYPQVQAGTFSDNTLHGRSKPLPSPEWPWGVRIGYSPDQEFTNALLLTLNLMAGNDQATVVASPQVMAQAGEEAMISVTTEEYFEILTRGLYSQSELEQIQAGTILKVTPEITDNGDITLQMSNEVSDVVARGQGGLPVVTRRETSSTVRVHDGGTVVVAGLMDNRTRYSGQRVPGVGAVPILGNPFRNDATEQSTRQLFIFITPRILADEYDETAPQPGTPQEVLPLVDEAEFRRELELALEHPLETP